MASGELLIHICAEPHLPAYRTVAGWVYDDNPPGFSQRYARARVLQATALAEEALEISDDSRRDTIIKTRGGEEFKAPDHEWLARSKLRVDARKWLAARLDPSNYGDRQRIEHSGRRAGKIKITEIQVQRPSVDGQKQELARTPSRIDANGR
jgi:hypothetical protein